VLEIRQESVISRTKEVLDLGLSNELLFNIIEGGECWSSRGQSQLKWGTMKRVSHFMKRITDPIFQKKIIKNQTKYFFSS